MKKNFRTSGPGLFAGISALYPQPTAKAILHYKKFIQYFFHL